MVLVVPEQTFSLKTSDFIGQKFSHQIARFPQKGYTPEGNFVALYMIAPVNGQNLYYTFGKVNGVGYTSEFQPFCDFSEAVEEFNNFFDNPPLPLIAENTRPGNEPV